MGTGKTVVGKMLAEKLSYQFLDTDQMVEQEAKKTVMEIFEREGETSFRRREKEMVKKALQKEKVVISTGGGAVMDPENLALFKENGLLIALSATPEVIYERVRSMKTRPLLKDRDELQTIKNLLSSRSPFYQKADLILDSSGNHLESVVSEIMKALHENSKS
ncbi:MAG: shikimate kinase [Deltaproteobacteria bacterium]|nr:shikimate kinase [Deltaproteobacteria bacterium]